MGTFNSQTESLHWSLSKDYGQVFSFTENYLEEVSPDAKIYVDDNINVIKYPHLFIVTKPEPSEIIANMEKEWYGTGRSYRNYIFLSPVI